VFKELRTGTTLSYLNDSNIIIIKPHRMTGFCDYYKFESEM